MKLFKKEKEVTDLASQYLDHASQCVKAGKSSVLAYLDDDFDAARDAQRNASILESDADASRRAIGDLLFSGAFLPLFRGDIFSIFEAFDKVPNAAESCCTFFTGQNPTIPTKFKAAFIEATTVSFDTIEGLTAAGIALFMKKGEFERLRSHIREVCDGESKVDLMEENLTKAIFESEDMDLSEKRHLKAALNRICHVSDVAENAADRLELAAMKSVI